ncbi:zinc finger protein Elbow isoform X1 [Hylaeus volcanicus]|uniref:zinc finger protein Elbow isoform X1 n=1 Tax=Hylaeus volcanicus TaxID=313075 RepID=UPI0023B8069B|nr:zinc finger protein Elbow isoform X1 [Hylaeus volcanicus]
MLTSSANQYLRPEYLTPLPTTLDAKKSPLALLAQACNQIGADMPSNKSLLGSLDKPLKSADQSREKSSPAIAPTATSADSNKTNFKPYESCLDSEKAPSPDEQRSSSSHSVSGRSRTPGSSSKRCSSNHSASSVQAVTPQGRKTATPNSDITRESPVARMSLTQLESSNSSQPTAAVTSSSVLAMTDPFVKDLPLGIFKPGVSLSSSSSGYLAYNLQSPVDAMASSLVSQHHAALKNGLVTGNPYLSYARLKTAICPDALMPLCRDPYCNGCQLNSHLFVSSASAAVANGKLTSSSGSTSGSCPAGCTQCDHKSDTPYGTLGVAAYAHAQLATMAATSQLPYICNWIASDTAYCGKRFSTSDELLQHLRSHTSVSASGTTDSSVATMSLLSPSIGLPPTHLLFSRTYPTPPLSPFATARYHPYGKSSLLFPPSLSPLGLPLPPPHPHSLAGLSPYFSPYSLYGSSRLGAASGMPQ